MSPTLGAPPRARNTLALVGLFAAVFLAMLDAQVVATALPRMVGELGGATSFAWVTTSYLLAGSVSAPVYGKLGDLFGRKRVVLVAIALFVLGSLACALAPTMPLLIAARVLQGIGSGGLFVAVAAIIGELFPGREGARYFAWFSICFAGSSLAGPVVGGVLTDLAGWRSIFGLNVPIGLVAFAAVARFLRLERRRTAAPFDFAGIVVLSGAIVGLTLATPLSTSIGAVLLAAFLLIERRAAEPVVPLRLFRSRMFSLSVLASAAAGFVFLGSVNYLALFLQTAGGAGPSEAGLLLLPMTLAVAASSMVAGRIIARTGAYRWAPILSMTLGLAAALAMSTMDETTPLPLVVAYLVVFGAAAGLNMQVLSMAAQQNVARTDLGAVSATVGFLRSLGTTAGLIVFGAMFTNAFTDDSPAGYSSALNGVFWVMVPALTVGLAASLFLPRVSLRRNH
ncbi:MDR family MFS transporter [Amycolatopsis keratiniphila]|uniref:MFS transporter n=1 Tax=Amycolatopsis keratiniphila subsp. keratiniphila TaxID=227715 RepID=A0A1W2LPR4_9PSEU|nr:MDR family MFS transporter [Amycolatopsis keratiniphila]ONF65601.1 MFS transporter [Amycolatopsis keratiniphila subsp. keratiniphila]